eukprot:c18457_g1_i1 orf=382-942(+)
MASTGKKGKENPTRTHTNMAGWVESVDRLLDSSPRFITALRAAFIRFQSPPPSSTIPPPSLLLALQFFLKRISEDLDPRVGRLCLRPITQEDLDSIAQHDPSLDLDQPIDADKFGRVAQKVLKHLALDRGKRLGLFIIGGIVVVHVLKGIIKRLPVIGPPVGTLMTYLAPSSIAGPAVGIAGAICM